MQFLPSSWEAFGVDGNGDGIKDPYNPWDAIFAAARLLRASGAPQDWHGAIFSYNHAEWYVAEVLADAHRFAGDGTVEASGGGCAAAASAPNETVARMVAEAARLSALRPTSEYVWGGSHGSSPTPPNGPFDCAQRRQSPAPGRRLRQPDDGHDPAGPLGRTGTGAVGDDLRQALRRRSPHLHPLLGRSDAAGRALLGHLGHRRARQGSGLDRRRQVLRFLPDRIRAATSAGTVMRLAQRSAQLPASPAAGLPARIVRASCRGTILDGSSLYAPCTADRTRLEAARRIRTCNPASRQEAHDGDG